MNNETPVYEIHTDDDIFYIYKNGLCERRDAISGSAADKREKLLIINRMHLLNSPVA